MEPEEYWNGLPGVQGSHRSVGPRAWCYEDNEWCYPHHLCNCCVLLSMPSKWEGLPSSEVIEKARADERKRIVKEFRMRCEALKHFNPCYVCDPYIRIVGDSEDYG